MALQTARKTAVIDLTDELEPMTPPVIVDEEDEELLPQETQTVIVNDEDEELLPQETVEPKKEEKQLRRSDRKKRHPSKVEDRDVAPLEPKKQKRKKEEKSKKKKNQKKRKVGRKGLGNKIRLGHSKVQDSVLSQCVALLEPLSNEDLMSLAEAIRVLLQNRSADVNSLSSISSTSQISSKQNGNSDEKKKKKGSKKKSSAIKQQSSGKRPQAYSEMDIPPDWPRELKVQYTNMLLWDSVASPHQKLRWQLSHRMRYKDQVRRPFQIKKILDPSNPCYGEYGLFSSMSLKKGDVLPDYSGRILVSHIINGKSVSFNRSKFVFLLKVLPNNDDTYEETDEGDREYQIDVDAEEAGNETRFINDVKGRNVAPNVKFFQYYDEQTGELRIGTECTSNIEPGVELLCDYGKLYWLSLSKSQKRDKEATSSSNSSDEYEPNIL